MGTSGAFTRSHGGGVRGEEGENHPAELSGREETRRPRATCRSRQRVGGSHWTAPEWLGRVGEDALAGKGPWLREKKNGW